MFSLNDLLNYNPVLQDLDPVIYAADDKAQIELEQIDKNIEIDRIKRNVLH